MKIEKFALRITLGNEALNNSKDVAATLEYVAKRIHQSTKEWPDGQIFDINGNKVGWFAFLEDLSG